MHKAAKKAVFMQIATRKDSFGPKILKEPLHLIVENSNWWKERILENKFEIFSEGRYNLNFEPVDAENSTFLYGVWAKPIK
ncbi:MAG: hypothetical protein MZU91_05800 [Desulfosudis oleivorans]|nr:hypothetical protein [Desulfosudis oleivorans]